MRITPIEQQIVSAYRSLLEHKELGSIRIEIEKGIWIEIKIERSYKNERN